METTYYAVDNGNGDNLCSGLSESIAYSTAQWWADRLGETVYLYEAASAAADSEEGVEPAPARAVDPRK